MDNVLTMLARPEVRSIMEWSAVAILVGLLVNAAIVAYSYGALNQKVKHLTEQANQIEARLNKKVDELSAKVTKLEGRLNGEGGGYYCPLLGRNVREADIGEGPHKHQGMK